MSRKQKKNLIRILITGVVLLAVWLAPIEGWLQFALFLIPYAIIGYDVLWSAVRNILRGQVFDENFLMALATVGAFATGEYPEAVAVILFYQVGELFQSIAVGKSRKSIAAMMELRPDHANVVRDGVEQTVSPEDVQVGEIIVVRPGERVPLDGVLVEGSSSLNTAALTGESAPRAVEPGESVVSGSINLDAPIRVRTTSVYGESTVAKVLELVENASSRKARAERFITRFAKVYTPCVVIGAALLAVIPPLLFGQNWIEWIQRALIFLVVSCPCALVISVPLSFFGGIGGGSKRGILIKGSNDLEALAHVRTVALDKTGTLTEGKFRVSSVQPAEGVDGGELLELAAHAELYSNHPIAESIRAACEKKPEPARVGEVEELPGLGVRAEIDGREICAGNRRLMAKMGAALPEDVPTGTSVLLCEGGKYLGAIALEDEFKPDAKDAVAALRSAGVDRLVLLTGDRREAGEAAAARLGLDEVRAELMPGDKVAAVEALIAEKPEGGTVAFVGDGINDAPVLARADVGIAMGAMGSDAAIEAADVVLMDDKPSRLAEAIRLARRTMGIVRQNIVFALTVKAIVLILSACGLTGMWMAVFADVGVSVLAILNAARAGHVKQG